MVKHGVGVRLFLIPILVASLMLTGCFDWFGTSTHLGTFREVGGGFKGCDSMATNMGNVAQRNTAVGLLASLVAGGLIVGGGALGPDKDEDAAWYEENRNVLVVGAGGLVALFAKFMFDRSDAASDAAAETQGALALIEKTDEDPFGLKSHEAYDKCVAAMHDFHASRKTANKNAQGTKDSGPKSDSKDKGDKAKGTAEPMKAPAAPSGPKSPTAKPPAPGQPSTPSVPPAPAQPPR